ncbi:hypothetical protein FACS1894168_1510 [Deltaproteobacteria bacterium]|nr:hypothetical protein FACS1894168_1510 [Deltaproteobacteria bacterium]
MLFPPATGSFWNIWVGDAEIPEGAREIDIGLRPITLQAFPPPRGKDPETGMTAKNFP